MIDAAQMILLLVIVSLAVVLLVLGVQVYFILKELRKTVTKANKVLDDAGTIANSISTPLSNLSTLSAGIKTGAFVAKILKKLRKDEDEESSHEQKEERKHE